MRAPTSRELAVTQYMGLLYLQPNVTYLTQDSSPTGEGYRRGKISCPISPKFSKKGLGTMPAFQLDRRGLTGPTLSERVSLVHSQVLQILVLIPTSLF